MRPIEHIASRILVVRGQRVMVDADLALLYGVTTKQLNQQVKRNSARFPADLAFRLRAKEKEDVVTNCDHLRRLRYSPAMPFVFTEHGALMAASVLNSPRAVEIGLFVVRACACARSSHRTGNSPSGWTTWNARSARMTGPSGRSSMRSGY